MRRKGPIVMLFLTIGVGVATAFLFYRWMAQQQLAVANIPVKTFLTQPVVVANVDLSPGTTLQSDSIRVMNWPRESVPRQALTNPAEVVDRVVLFPTVAGEPILASKLADRGVEGGLSALIRPGKRAVSVRVDEMIGVAGFVVPGSVVDVLFTVEEKENRKVDATTKTILQNIKVLASGQKMMQEDKGKPILVNVVTLEVTPEEAAKLALGSNRGRIQLALRNQTDETEIKVNEITTLELIRGPAAEPRPKVITVYRTVPVRPLPEARTVEVVLGGTRTSQKVKE